MPNVTEAEVIALIPALLALASSDTICVLERRASYGCGPAQLWSSSCPHHASNFFPAPASTNSTAAIPTAYTSPHCLQIHLSRPSPQIPSSRETSWPTGWVRSQQDLISLWVLIVCVHLCLLTHPTNPGVP